MTPLKLFVLACLSVGISSIAFAQATSTAQIQGTVRDASNAVVTGVGIRVTKTNPGRARPAPSGPDGGYVIASLPTGPYTLETTVPGFARFVQSGITWPPSGPEVAVRTAPVLV